jgi:hypothetical protein
MLLWLGLLYITATTMVLVQARPSHYDEQLLGLNNEEKHRHFMMDVIQQQFMRTVELYEGENKEALDNVFTQRLYDMMFHLFFWRHVPECGGVQEKQDLSLVNETLYPLLTAYYSGDSVKKRDAVLVLHGLLRVHNPVDSDESCLQ